MTPVRSHGRVPLWPLLAAAASLATCPAHADEATATRAITVYAAASLREVLSDIATEFAARTGTPARVEFDASSALARRIQGGAPVDVFVSADAAWLDAVAPAERFDWLGNRLVCVTRPAAARDCRNANTLVLGGEQVPVGKYAVQALANLGAAQPGRIVYGSNTRDVLRNVEEGAGDAGVVYQTDALIAPTLRVSFVFPASSHAPIVYPAGRLSAAGDAFWRALRSPWALELARQRGFGVPQ